MFWRRSIKAKIVSALLLLAGLTFAAIAVLSVVNMQRLSRYTLQTISQLGQAAVADSRKALRAQTQKELLSLAESQAFAIDLQLEKIMADVRLIAGTASHLLQSTSGPGTFSPRVTLEKPDAPDMYSAFRLAPGVVDTRVAAELTALSNIHTALALTKANSRHLRLVFIGTESGIFLKHPWSRSPLGYDPRQRGWYKDAVDKGNICWTSPYKAASYNCLVVSCSTPFYDSEGQTAGVAAVDVSVDSLANDFIGQQARRRGNAFLVDRQGNLIAGHVFKEETADSARQLAWDEDVDLQRLTEHPLVAVQTLGNLMINAADSGIYRYEIEGREYFVAYAPIAATGGCVGINLPASSIDAPIVQTEKRILTATHSSRLYVEAYFRQLILIYGIAVLVLLVIVVCSGFFLSRRITRPIMELDRGAKEIGGGNLDFRFNIKTGDEIEDLARTFNNMTADLKRYIQNLGETLAAKEKIESDLKVGREIQAAMLPRIFPPFPERPEFDIYAEMKPAHEVAGDFYDFFFIDAHHLFFCIGDVSGKGVPAALFMAITKTLIKDDALRGYSPDQVLAHVNNALEPGNDACMFATVFCGILDTRSGQVWYSNAGHNPPLVKRGARGYQYLKTPRGFVVGPMPMPTDTWECGELRLGTGDVLFLYSDGVTEAMNPQKELFSTQRLQDVLNAAPDNDVGATVRHIMAAVRRHAQTEAQSDDIAVLLVKMC